MGYASNNHYESELKFSFRRVVRQTMIAIVFVALLATYTARNATNASTTAPAPPPVSQTQQN